MVELIKPADAGAIYPMGEDGEWMFGEGHIHPAVFLSRAAVEWPESFEDIPADEWPTEADVKHCWYLEIPAGADPKFPDGYHRTQDVTADTPGAKPGTFVRMD